jgi:hypothetical protein
MAGRWTTDTARAVESLEDVMGVVTPISDHTRFVRLRILHAMHREPQLSKVLYPAFRELDEIEGRVQRAGAAVSEARLKVLARDSEPVSREGGTVPPSPAEKKEAGGEEV